MKAAAALIIALAISAGALFMYKQHAANHSSQLSTSSVPVTDTESNLTASPPADSSVTSSSTISSTIDTAETDTTERSSQPQSGSPSDTIAKTQTATDQDSIDVVNLGKQPLTDTDFRYWVGRLRSDPLLLQATLTEYLENTDPIRARHLAAVLAEVNSPTVVDTAVQLAQSIDSNSQQAGLVLLARLQPNNTHARNAALDLLATQDDPALLVATLNVFATPAQAVATEQRQLLLDQAQLLLNHSDANVRALSISTITKWSKGNSNTQAATIGLNDSDIAVRTKSAASLIGAQNPTAQTKAGLLTMAANKQEPKGSRQLALYALSKMSLTETERVRYEALEIELRQTR